MVLRRDRSQAGFSLIELLMVAAIILIIGAMAIPGLVRARSSAGEASAVSTLRVLFQGEGRYSNLFDNSYSPDLNSLGAPKPGDTFLLMRPAALFPQSATTPSPPIRRCGAAPVRGLI